MLMMSLVLSLALHEPKIVLPGEGEVVGVPFHPVLKLVGGSENADAVTIYEFTVPAKSAGAPPHIHSNEDEYFYVVSGTASFMNGEDVVEAPAGSFAALTRGNLHAFWNAGDEEAVMVMMTVGGIPSQGAWPVTR